MSKKPPKKHLWSVDVPAQAPGPLDYALSYARLGWAVLPVWSVTPEGKCRCGRSDSDPGHKVGKHPHSQLAPHGHLDATTDEQTLRDWWAADPEAGVGISLSSSGLLALDIDPRNGGDETLAKLEAEHGVLHSDCVAVTQGGGEHRLFRADPAHTYPGNLGPGLDLKHHGYVCVAPTLGPSGEYRWAEGGSPLSAGRPAQPSALPEYIRTRGRTEGQYSLTERSGVPVATAQTFDDLRSALEHISADDYTLWVNVGMALRPYGENGYRIWTEWSGKSSKFDAGAQRRKWERDLSSPHSITYRSIFRIALDSGWSGTSPPNTTTPHSPPTTVHPLSLVNNVGSGAAGCDPVEFLFDDFMSTGINVVSGAPGVGKTTLVIPLALAVAHLCPPDFPLRPEVRRNVIIVTESAAQVRQVVYSVYRWGYTGHRAEEFDLRVRVIPAQRLDAKIVAGIAEEYRAWTVDNPTASGGVYAALPLVVLDTANAVFDLENENDNAEVGRAMAYVKQSFSAFPVVIVAHTAKALGLGEADYLTPRGASAWMGDAHGVYSVFKDGDAADSPRVMKAGKVRFTPRWGELTFELVKNKETHPNVLEQPRDVWFAHAVARPLETGAREALREERKHSREEQDFEDLLQAALDLVRANPGRGQSALEQVPISQGGLRGGKEKKMRAFEHLKTDGRLREVALEKPNKRQTSTLEVDEAQVAARRGGGLSL